MPGIEARNLFKHFGDKIAVDGLSFAVEQGEIYGLLGPNGAGKTTTLRMLAGLMKPTAGSALICGLDVTTEQEEAKASMSFMTGTTGLYERLTPREILAYFGGLYGIPPQRLRDRIAELTVAFKIGHLLDRRCGTLSTGERQRISLARALIHDPPVLILDEPTAGLDVLASRFVAETIHRARERGRAILMSTHYMAEAELLCDRIGLLHQGGLLREGAPADLRRETEARSLEESFLRLIEREYPS